MAYMSEEGYKKLVAELQYLEGVRRPEIIQQIAEARDKGDLSENAEYDAAKEAQGMLEAKIATLKAQIADAKIIDEKKIDTSAVQILTKVKLRNNGYWVYVSNGTFTFNTSNATQLQLEYVMDSQDPVRTTLFSTLSGGMDIPPYRIPGITCGKDGRLYASAARLVCGTDPGYGQVDCVVKISNDNGTTWSSQEIDVAVGDASLINNVKTPMQAAYGDPAIVADRESDEVLVMAVGGCTVYTYSSTNRNNPNIIAAIRSTDGGQTWQTPVEQTEMIYGLFDSGNPMAAAFVGGGRLFQSRIV